MRAVCPGACTGWPALWLLCALGALVVPARAQPQAQTQAQTQTQAQKSAEAPTPPAPAGGQTNTQADTQNPQKQSPERQVFATRAEQIRQLMAASLPASVDERTLFALDLRDVPESAGAALVSLLRPAAEHTDQHDSQPGNQGATATADTGQAQATKAPVPEAAPTAPGEAAPAPPPQRDPVTAWLDALRAWAALPVAERAQLVDGHRKKREAYAAAETKKRARDRELQALRTEAEQLRALLAGTLPLEVDPQPLLRIDLSAWPSLAAPASALPKPAPEPEPRKARRPKKGRRPKAEPAPQEPPPAQEPPPPDPDPELSAARATIADLRMKVLRLSKAERLALLVRHEERREAAKQSEVVAARKEADEAEDAARAAAAAHEQALEQVKKARTEAARAIATEHARLLGIQEQHARFEATLAQHAAAATERRNIAVEWGLKVRALENRSVLEGPRYLEADRIYDDLIDDLRAIRARLASVLDAIEKDDSEVPPVGDEAALPEHGEMRALMALRRQLLEQELALQRKEAAQRWQEAAALHEDMESLNHARLKLLLWLSPAERARYTGSGPEAVRQAKAEAQQIILEMRARGLALPRELRSLRDDLATSPLPVIWGFLQFALVLALFRSWRKRSGAWLGALRRKALSASPPTAFSAQMSTLLWYVIRIRKPLEALAMIALVIGLFGQTGQALGLDYVWLVASWGLTGSAVVRYLDSVAARQHLRAGSGGSAELRIRSLRLLGIMVVGTGLLLSLFELTVGRGTVYEWVWDGCWMLLIPSGALLIRWWRPTILSMIEARPEKTAFFQWVRTYKRGPRSYVGAAAGGLYLLGEGLWGWLRTEAGEWEVTRRLLAYLFRTEAARQAVARGDRETGVPLDEQRGKSLYPQMLEEVVVATAADTELAGLVEAIEAKSCTLAVVSGERGSGKSVLLRRLAEHFEGGVLTLSCPPHGLSALLRSIRKDLSLENGASDEEIVKAINERGPKVVIIDDLQRAIRPAIGGLSPLDRLVSLARDTDDSIAWVLAIGAPAWNYVARARSERIAFDRVVALKGWTEEQIGQWLRKCNETAGIRPSFEGLVVARQMEDANEETTGRAERGYYRILWDYSGGNPALALYWWRKSLYESPNGEISVRLFRPPDLWDLETVPLTVRFTLRAILQLDWAHPNQLAESLEMSPSQVDETLRYAQGRGYLERDGQRVRIAWHWLRAITVALKRQHLIAG